MSVTDYISSIDELSETQGFADYLDALSQMICKDFKLNSCKFILSNPTDAFIYNSNLSQDREYIQKDNYYMFKLKDSGHFLGSMLLEPAGDLSQESIEEILLIVPYASVKIANSMMKEKLSLGSVRETLLDDLVKKTFSSLEEDGFMDPVLEKLAKLFNVEYCLVLKDSKVYGEFILDKTKTPESFLGQSKVEFFRHSIKSLIQKEIFPDCVLCAFNTFEDKEWLESELEFFERLSDGMSRFFSQYQSYKDALDRIDSLEEQNKKLKQLDDLKTQLINTVSHELRTPLVSIMGFSNMLKRHEPTKELIRESSDQILLAGQRLSRMVDDFILLNRAESQGWVVNFEALDIGEIGRYVVNEFSPIHKKHDFNFEFPEDYPMVRADRKLLRQVLDNLIMNAIKYSPEGGRVLLAIETDKLKNRLFFHIKDEGIGLMPEEQGKVFERFYRVQSRETESISGMGLGLAICNDIINRLNGEISTTSEYGRGSTFTISLPIIS